MTFSKVARKLCGNAFYKDAGGGPRGAPIGGCGMMPWPGRPARPHPSLVCSGIAARGAAVHRTEGLLDLAACCAVRFQHAARGDYTGLFIRVEHSESVAGGLHCLLAIQNGARPRAGRLPRPEFVWRGQPPHVSTGELLGAGARRELSGWALAGRQRPGHVRLLPESAGTAFGREESRLCRAVCDRLHGPCTACVSVCSEAVLEL